VHVYPRRSAEIRRSVCKVSLVQCQNGKGISARAAARGFFAR
jgi:hypothetical protein